MAAVRTLLWQRIDKPGFEYFTLGKVAAGWQLAGTVLLCSDNKPRLIRYKIACDERWNTQDLEIIERIAGKRRRLLLSAAELLGYTDVDLGFTPATNTLPIRRLGLRVQDSTEIVCAWVRYPGLALEPLKQRYTRLAENRYRYESKSFCAELQVDELGLVRNYEGAWKAVAVI